MRKGPAGINQSAISRSAFKCNNCKKAFSGRDVFLDLTITAGLKEYEEVLSAGTELFRNPLVSFVYERGWRQNFARSGFPGPDEEVKLAQEFLKPTAGGILLDVSCGSGLFSRRFAKSEAYSAVIALDFSENMLRQTHDLVKQDRALVNRNLALVRADVARLPFATGTIDAVHAGAALHCWPSPSAGVAEISRILRPGGVFVATTFLSPVTDLRIGALKSFQQMEVQCSTACFAGAASNVKGGHLHIAVWNAHLLGRLGTREREEVKRVIDEMGLLSAQAQQLKCPVTSFDRMCLYRAHCLYVLFDSCSLADTQEGAKMVLVGMLKVGAKDLFIRRLDGSVHEMSLPCVLDFYIHHSFQRYDIAPLYLLTSTSTSPSNGTSLLSISAKSA
ncbi:hypothetical protein L7F22_017454 [Adiantum nelumboides]|nr:hypothetical protein [Adiantum nelumboides]